jgi:hypothetical protein
VLAYTEGILIVRLAVRPDLDWVGSAMVLVALLVLGRYTPGIS